jgi:hypothetical protein
VSFVIGKHEPEVGKLRRIFIPAAPDDSMLHVAQVERVSGLFIFAFFTEKLYFEVLIFSLNADEFVFFILKDVKN